MFPGVFFIAGFSAICIAFLLIIKQKYAEIGYFDKINKNFILKQFQSKHKTNEKSYLSCKCGSFLLKNNVCLDRRVLYPKLKVNSFAVKNYVCATEIDDKINNCKLVFKSKHSICCIENYAKYIINLLIYDKNCNILQIIKNIKIWANLNSREYKYLRLLVLEEIILWIDKLNNELNKQTTKINNAKKFKGKLISKRNINSNAYIYGLAKYNDNTMKYVIKQNININKSIQDFFVELKDVDSKVSLLIDCFEKIRL